MSSRSSSRLAFWSGPAVGVIIGIAFFVLAWVGGQPWLAVATLAIMLVFSAALVLASRSSETVRGLMNRRDERIVGIDLRATAATGSVLILAIIAGALAELARGHSGAPFIWLGAIGGITYATVVIVERIRR